MSNTAINLAISILSVIFLNLPSAHAFNSSKCGEYISMRDGTTWGLGISTIHATYGATSFVSSTGACRAIGRADERRNFIRETHEQIAKDSARGRGEYLGVLARLCGCTSQVSQDLFVSRLRKNYSGLFSDLSIHDAREAGIVLSDRIERLLQADRQLAMLCQTEFDPLI